MMNTRVPFLILVLIVLAEAGGTSAQQKPITIFLAGDSTMAHKLPEKRPETGWGEMLGEYFQDSKVTVDNRAQNGRSTRTFISEGR